jgi:3-methyladenine DNA glycosylase AlkD
MDSIPDLLNLVQYPHPIVRQSVAWCLGQIGHRDPAVFQALRTLQSDTDNSVAKIAEQILNQLMK